MFFLELRSNHYNLIREKGFFFLFGERLRLGLEFFICIAEIWSSFFLIFFLSFLWFLFILFLNFCSWVFTVAILVCVGLCIVFVYVWSFFVILSTVFFLLFRFIIVSAEVYLCGLSCISFCHITDVHGIKFGFLVVSLFEKIILVIAIFFSRWILCFMVFYWVCCI